jgi:HAD superfamily hydrolase (TIGR01509 family)
MRAIVFDLDGVLVDTESTDFAAWDRAYRDHGQRLPRDAWVSAIGSDGSRFDPLLHLRELVGEGFDEDAMQRARRAHRDSLTAGLAPLPGVVELLDAADRAGLALAVASSSEREWVEGHLSNTGLRERFRLLRCKEDVPRVKPDPALYREAVAALEVAPREAVAIEDSPNGVAAAVEAGLFCVAVPGPMTRGLDFSRAQLCVSTLADTSLEEILTSATAPERGKAL